MAVGDVTAVFDTSIKFVDNARLDFGDGTAGREGAGDASLSWTGSALAFTGALSFGGALDLNAAIDLDVALVAAGDMLNGALTINHATAAVQGLDISAAQLTTPRTSGTVDAILASTTSLAADSGGTYNSFRATRTDGGGTVTHNGLLVESGFDVGIQGAAELSLRAWSGSAMSIGDGVATLSMTSGALTGSSLTTAVLTFSGLYTVNAGAGFLFDSTGAEDPITFRFGDDLPASIFTIENNSLNDLLTVTADGIHARYVKDNEANAYTIAEAGNAYFVLDTSNAGARLSFGNATTNPGFTFLGTGTATFTGGVTSNTLTERTSNSGITLGSGVEIVGVPKTISAAVAFNTADGALFTVPGGETWLITACWAQTIDDWDGNGAFIIGVTADPDGFLTMANASLDPAYDETGGAAGWPTGSRGLESTNRGPLLAVPTSGYSRAYRAVAGTTILIDNTPGTSSTGNADVFITYTRI